MTTEMALTSEIMHEIKKFEALQTKYERLGAKDTEPDSMFHAIIRWAVTGHNFDGDLIEWDLYDDMRGGPAAAKALSRQARKVYDAIITHGKLTDRPTLATYAWRMGF